MSELHTNVSATLLNPYELRIGNMIMLDGERDMVNSIAPVMDGKKAIDWLVNGISLQEKNEDGEVRLQPAIVTRQMLYDHNFRLSQIHQDQLEHESKFMQIKEDLQLITIPALYITFALQPPYFHNVQNIFFYLSGRELERKKLIIT